MMLRERVTDQLLSNIARLNSSTEFKIFLEFLQANLNQFDKDNRTYSGETLYRSQGAALTLDAILKLSKDASAILSSRKL